MSEQPTPSSESQLELLQRRFERERTARKEAERILEEKAAELYSSNQQLQEINQGLEEEMDRRSKVLIDQQRNYEQIVESVTDVIFSIDGQDKLLYMNEAGLRLFGHKESDLSDLEWNSMITDSHRSETMDFFRYEVNLRKEASYLEFPIVNSVGRSIWLGMNAQYIYGPEGVVEVTCIARDITDRRLVEERLKRSEEKYRGIIENMDLGLMEVNNEGIIVRAYRQFCNMVGFTTGELMGKRVERMLIPSRHKEAYQLRADIHARGEQALYEIELNTKSGTPIWVMVSEAPIYSESGALVGSIGIHFDITARKRTEQELARAKDEAIQAKDAEKAFLARMSHEIRTPMNAVIGMSHMLQETPLDEEQKELAESVIHSANLLRGLINSVLDLSKIEAGKFEVHLRDFDLKDFAQSLQKTFEFRMDGSDVDVLLDWDDTLPEKVHSDELILNQILMNLLGNAAKFTERGHIVLGFKNVTTAPNTLKVEMSVSDTGIGMSADQLAHIFDRFRQATSEIMYTYGGSGLGLAITQELVNLLEGSIEVTSTHGEGACFKVSIPLEVGKSSSVLQEEAKEIVFNDRSILIAEDNPMNISYLEKMLGRWKINYVISRDGQEAFEESEKQAFDLILMDIQMPRLDGYEAAEAIRNASNNPNHSVPIVALSAQAFQEDIAKAHEVGMDDYLTKPYTPRQLQVVLEKHFGSHHVSSTESSGPFRFAPELNQEHLDTFYDGDLEYVFEMFGAYLENAPSAFESLARSINHNQMEAKGAVHRVKPTFSMVGLLELHEEAQSLESSMEKLPLPLSDAHVDRLTALKTNFQLTLQPVRETYVRLAALINSDPHD